MCGILLWFDKKAGFGDRLEEFNEGDVLEQRVEDALPMTYKSHYIGNRIIPLIANRGPNYSSLRSIQSCNTMWFSSILSLRQPFTTQSMCVGDRFILQFNGELYNEEIQFNDTQYIASKLMEQPNDIYGIIRELEGEFAYTIFDKQEQCIYFGRDSIGKRSLSYQCEDGILTIASVTGHNIDAPEYENCLAGVIYMFDILTTTLDTTTTIQSQFTVTSKEDPEQLSLNTTINELYETLSLAVNKRIESIHPKHIENSPIAILFSGGLDCSVLVALICQHLTQKNKQIVIELLNVAFENPRTGLQPCDAPDRKLAIQSATFLQELFPTITIHLVEIDVPYDTYLEVRPHVIDLMYPKQTEMDLSIAIAFHFASGGVGFIKDKTLNERIPYTRHGIVLFSGLGADELYGGYHKFNNKSTDELVIELTRQINNIHDRNLNRDDKVIADNGVEVRYPFLDVNVIKYSTESIPITFKTNKLILREMATQNLSLGFIALEPKRAIQFGSKSAKMTKDGNKNGTDLLK
ncbi:hypothetical protein MOUN0_M10374 [Monosporozyma unispora]